MKSSMVARGSMKRNVDVQGFENGGVFDPDHAGADDGYGARQVVHAGYFVAVDDGGAVERDVGRAVGAGADGDDKTVGGSW